MDPGVLRNEREDTGTGACSVTLREYRHTQKYYGHMKPGSFRQSEAGPDGAKKFFRFGLIIRNCYGFLVCRGREW
jgi:hypothetical protein